MTPIEFEKLAELLFPHITMTPEDLEEKYPPRNLKESARVTRFAPSPTGYLHVGGLFGALTDYMTAKASDGIMYLRVEDTDKKREIADGVSAIIEGFQNFGIAFDEGVTGLGTEKGDYGPYTQSQRVEIYQTIAKSLVKKGLAYPCFCSAEELTALREKQEKDGADIRGYFGKYAKCRDLTFAQIEENLAAGKSYVLRFRSDGDPEKRIAFQDVIKGKIEMPENIIDEVLLKSDGIPTYHFAHVCDDHFMRTTHVIRGEEWISSVPKHIALFKACGYKTPKYAHTPQVMKIDEVDGTKRKFSKRKDPEAAVGYFIEKGYPKEALTEYLMTLLNSDFEAWRTANPDKHFSEFKFKLQKMSASGALFDLAKLNDISKNCVAKMTAEEVYDRALVWAKQFHPAYAQKLESEKDKAIGMLSLDRGGKKPRKDLAKWDELPDTFSYMYADTYEPSYTLPEHVTPADAEKLVRQYAEIWSMEDDKDTWFSKVKSLCEPNGFTPNVKEYKQNPEAFKGHVGDVSTVLRVAVTGRTQTPDLYVILRLLGADTVAERLSAAAAYYRTLA